MLIVQVTLDKYEPDVHDDVRGEPHNWVDGVVRSEGRGAVVSCDTSSSCMIIRPQQQKKDPSLLTREEIETPKIWAQIWHQQLVLAAVIRHMDHKNVMHDPQLKSYVIQVAAVLARQIRSEVVLSEIGFVSDLCRHLRKSLQATFESVAEQESNLNVLLQNSIEDCLLEVAEGEPCIMKLSEDQIAQLLSAFWIQANLPDNLPSNIEAIAHSCDTISLRLKRPSDGLVVRIFQLSYLSEIYPWNLTMVDPYLGISDDLQVHGKPQADVREYGSVADNQLASSLLLELRSKIFESDKVIIDTLIQSLSNATKDIPTSLLIEDDVISEASVADMTHFISKMPVSPSVSHVISIGKLLESALEVAGQVAGTSISTSPLPYDTMAKQCEDLGEGTRKKLSNWLAHKTHYSRGAGKFLTAFPATECTALEKIMCDATTKQGAVKPMNPCLAMRLPPASPFDNF
ncbi:hypothetical protein GH714_006213 [Hevea brasiliensis]|uniref:Uncharacterized protein n=1 Tax=Hevea brasiliensis TaxID=3981 RepID=A0A6A6NFZ3_HEVBR|nr:hypothetical protein GH714_006213 [Hevea brasiliensis]